MNHSGDRAGTPRRPLDASPSHDGIGKVEQGNRVGAGSRRSCGRRTTAHAPVASPWRTVSTSQRSCHRSRVPGCSPTCIPRPLPGGARPATIDGGTVYPKLTGVSGVGGVRGIRRILFNVTRANCRPQRQPRHCVSPPLCQVQPPKNRFCGSEFEGLDGTHSRRLALTIRTCLDLGIRAR